ncbi:Pr6Pr family membrane protein [Roseivivax sediminis]|uniref:FAR-17a/AIG1-like protein n=1 Tax=Roseivivax sediminis TaxID=936889 RepID=A0A1I2AB23_9RHOB|nr:Pr6Pr family membrane protein [Roseivivax sediminis]SFE40183.1 hypothetical protein SAMN04515678_109134 [Roseivivax sediminis]
MRPPARFSALLIGLLACITLVVHVRLGLARRPELTLIEELWRTGRYFTILTVAILAAHFTWIGLRGRLHAAAAGAVTLWIAIVGGVYHALLWRPLEGARLIVDHSMHTALPLLAALWWLTFAPKAALRPAHALWWLAWPGLYVVYVLARGAVDGRHPYFFVDPPRIGWPMVGLWIGALAAIFTLAGLALVALGRRLSRT